MITLFSIICIVIALIVLALGALILVKSIKENNKGMTFVSAIVSMAVVALTLVLPIAQFSNNSKQVPTNPENPNYPGEKPAYKEEGIDDLKNALRKVPLQYGWADEKDSISFQFCEMTLDGPGIYTAFTNDSEYVFDENIYYIFILEVPSYAKGIDTYMIESWPSEFVDECFYWDTNEYVSKGLRTFDRLMETRVSKYDEYYVIMSQGPAVFRVSRKLDEGLNSDLFVHSIDAQLTFENLYQNGQYWNLSDYIPMGFYYNCKQGYYNVPVAFNHYYMMNMNYGYSTSDYSQNYIYEPFYYPFSQSGYPMFGENAMATIDSETPFNLSCLYLNSSDIYETGVCTMFVTNDPFNPGYGRQDGVETYDGNEYDGYFVAPKSGKYYFFNLSWEPNPSLFFVLRNGEMTFIDEYDHMYSDYDEDLDCLYGKFTKFYSDYEYYVYVVNLEEGQAVYTKAAGFEMGLYIFEEHDFLMMEGMANYYGYFYHKER